MRRTSVSLFLLATLALVAAPTPVNATTPTGPVCFSTEPLGDILAWFFDPHGSVSGLSFFDAVGVDLAGNRAQSVSFWVDSEGVLHWGYTTYPSEGFDPVIAGGVLDLSTLEGAGVCYAPDFASCGDFTLKVIECPGAAPPAASSAAVQGQR